MFSIIEFYPCVWLTRCGTWLEAASYYANNYRKIKIMVNNYTGTINKIVNTKNFMNILE